ncbi:cell envelope biogenesis protein TolA [Tardiphaga sp.]|uniref:cell envelope biogenesis protein TolA n=1 Tax=Tardiphaga sp. TaxID=1926292 RepID=UPI002631FB84|nr:cell envelope biogenesis protein TolA [Tardiphaga sp.]MDB5620162.1 cell envelope biosis protein TolA [Tardiphaga sp.]
MARKLKIYQTSIGFFDLAIAAPSMKAALDVWGADSNLFHQGFAKEVKDPSVVAAALEHPGVVLKRPVGTQGAFKETAELPRGLASGAAKAAPRQREAALPRCHPAPQADSKGAREAAVAFEKQKRKREAARQREELTRSKQREKIAARIAKEQDALQTAGNEHDARIAAIQAERDDLDKREGSENDRWEKKREKLASMLRRAKAED